MDGGRIGQAEVYRYVWRAVKKVVRIVGSSNKQVNNNVFCLGQKMPRPRMSARAKLDSDG